MGSRNRGRAPTAAKDAGIEHPESGDSGEEIIQSQQWIILGPEIGPLCTLCRNWMATRHHQDFGAICINCKDKTEGNLITGYWGMLRGPEGIAVNHVIRRHIAGYIWGKGANNFCYCGLCQAEWLANGWICRGD